MKKVTKSTRVPVSGQRDILSVIGQDPNFRYAVVNDVPGRLQKFQRAGYEHVSGNEVQLGETSVEKPEQGSGHLSIPVGVGRDNQVMYGYVMKIPKEWYEEDQARKMEAIDQREKEMTANPSKQQGFYGEIKSEYVQ